MLAEPYWRHAYRVLRGQYEMLEFRLQGYLKDDEERVSYLDARERSIKHLYKRCQEMRVDYVARLKALGVSENDIKEFDVYWKEQMDESLLS
ncbi:MAG TPA: hypothetical protein VHV10_18010 [Ktedonobacteraceae bacterium]|jgi:hypothetical protein|nr:hypothetical protein [Ktedonobacteraceae bacterium]